MENQANLQSLQVLESCEKLLADGKTEAALKELIKIASAKYRFQFVSLSNRLKRLTNQFNKGLIDHDQYETGVNRINLALMTTMQEFEAALKGGKIGMGWTTFYAVVLGSGLLVAFLGYWTLRPTQSTNIITCQEAAKTSIRVANFKALSEEDNFSISLINKLRKGLDEQVYVVAGTDYLSPRNANNIDSILTNYYSDCDTSGLFVYGIWDKESAYFLASINIIRLKLKIPGLSSNNSITLEDPPSITFSISKDSEFLSKFIIGILKPYEGEPHEALKLIKELKTDDAALKDKEVMGFLSFMEGNCYAMRGDKERAKQSYYAAVTLVPSLKLIALKNNTMAERVEQIMQRSPELRPILWSNLKEDSLLDVNIEHIDSIKNQPVPPENEKEIIEEVATEIEEGKEALPPSPVEQKKKESPDTSVNTPEVSKEPTEVTPKETVVSSSENEIRDKEGNVYPTQIMKDGKRWMTKNLNIKVKDSWCYQDKDSYCDKYGRLYTWEAAKEACEALGDGWRLPTDDEWREMSNAYGGYYDYETSKYVGNPESAYQALLENGNSGFAAQLGGWRRPDGSFNLEGSNGYYWSSSPSGSSNAWYYDFDRNYGKLYRYYDDRGYGRSVRCRQGS